MDTQTKERLRVVGEMAEQFFPDGFCSEVVALADQLPSREAAEVLAAYDFFLQTQKKYHETASAVYSDQANTLRGEHSREEWRLDFLVENAKTPYDDEAVRRLNRVVEDCERKAYDRYEPEDLRRLMEAVATLEFYMSDSPAYPSERPLKFYQFLYSAGRLRTISYTLLIRSLLRHAGRLLAEHKRLVGAARANQLVGAH